MLGKKKENKEQPKNPYIMLLPSTGGRQRKTLTEQGWRLVSTLGQFQATDEEIATALSGDTLEDWDNITVDTLTNEYNGKSFRNIKPKAKTKVKAHLGVGSGLLLKTVMFPCRFSLAKTIWDSLTEQRLKFQTLLLISMWQKQRQKI